MPAPMPGTRTPASRSACRAASTCGSGNLGPERSEPEDGAGSAEVRTDAAPYAERLLQRAGLETRLGRGEALELERPGDVGRRPSPGRCLERGVRHAAGTLPVAQREGDPPFRQRESNGMPLRRPRPGALEQGLGLLGLVVDQQAGESHGCGDLVIDRRGALGHGEGALVRAPGLCGLPTLPVHVPDPGERLGHPGRRETLVYLDCGHEVGLGLVEATEREVDDAAGKPRRAEELEDAASVGQIHRARNLRQRSLEVPALRQRRGEPPTGAAKGQHVADLLGHVRGVSKVLLGNGVIAAHPRDLADRHQRLGVRRRRCVFPRLRERLLGMFRRLVLAAQRDQLVGEERLDERSGVGPRRPRAPPAPPASLHG